MVIRESSLEMKPCFPHAMLSTSLQFCACQPPKFILNSLSCYTTDIEKKTKKRPKELKEEKNTYIFHPHFQIAEATLVAI